MDTTQKVLRKNTNAVPIFCPKCKQIMKHKFDGEAFKRENKCYECIVKHETELKRDGLWEEYVRTKQISNLRSQLKYQQEWEIEYLKNLKNIEFVQNSAGTMENWEVTEEQVNNAKKIHEDKLKEIEEMLKELENELNEDESNEA